MPIAEDDSHRYEPGIVSKFWDKNIITFVNLPHEELATKLLYGLQEEVCYKAHHRMTADRIWAKLFLSVGTATLENIAKAYSPKQDISTSFVNVPDSARNLASLGYAATALGIVYLALRDGIPESDVEPDSDMEPVLNVSNMITMYENEAQIKSCVRVRGEAWPSTQEEKINESYASYLRESVTKYGIVNIFLPDVGPLPQNVIIMLNKLNARRSAQDLNTVFLKNFWKAGGAMSAYSFEARETEAKRIEGNREPVPEYLNRKKEVIPLLEIFNDDEQHP